MFGKTFSRTMLNRIETRSLATSSHDLGNEVAKKFKTEGDRIPTVTFKARVRDPNLKTDNPFKWKDVTSNELFVGRRNVLFAVPGAFTPTCDQFHVPGYHVKYDEIREQNIDEVYCLSVNDAFVMRRWGLNLGLQEELYDDWNPLNPGNFITVKMIPDGAAIFTRAMGMNCVWDKERGFGERSWRYSMVVNDGNIEKMFVEGGCVTQNSVDDPFTVSDADTMLNYLKSKPIYNSDWLNTEEGGS